MKKNKKWILNSLLSSAIRKLWKNCPLKKLALDLACVDMKQPVKQRMYVCNICKNTFRVFDVEIDHLAAAPLKENLDERIKRLFLNFSTIDESTPIEETVKEHLQCLCNNCHKIKTKEENKNRKASTSKGVVNK
jgi:5-methylcytosine-specific restriction endonuclease McrA